MPDEGKHASTKRRSKRDLLWPDAADLVFDPSDRAFTKGYAQVPRVVPLVARLANELESPVNAGPLYQVLWAQDWGQGIVEVRSFKQLLYEAGYTGRGTRIERTWDERIKILKKLELIRTAPRGLDNYGFLLLVDPYLASLRLAGSTYGPRMSAWLVQFKLFCEQWGVDLAAYQARLDAMEAAS